MLKFVLSRAVAAIPVIIIVSIATFALLRLAPGDPATALAGESATPEVVAAIREQFGLDKPLYIQYKIWIENMLEGDFGTSIISGQPVIDMIIDRLEPTLSLALVTITFAVLIAIPLGILAAAKRGTVIDKLVMLLAVVGFSVPVFVVAYILILFMSVDLQWFPVQGFRSIRDGIGEFALYITLPATANAALCGADHANDAHQHSRSAERGFRAHRARQGHIRNPGPFPARIGKCRRADHHNCRDQLCDDADGGGGDRKRFQPSWRGPADHRRRSGA